MAVRVNENYIRYMNKPLLSEGSDYKRLKFDNEIINLSLSDHMRPLVPAISEAMQNAVAEMATHEGFRGYADANGYLFLRQAICTYFMEKGIALDEDEVFVGDGIKSDIGNILELFSENNRVLMPGIINPDYVKANALSGKRITFLRGSFKIIFCQCLNKQEN